MNKPQMIHVKSSNVDSIGYDSSESKLYIKFLNGSEYVYSGVPLYIYEDLLSTNSVGTYLHIYIKNQYHYEKI